MFRKPDDIVTVTSIGIGDSPSCWVTVSFIGVITSMAVIPLIKVSTNFVSSVSIDMVYWILGIRVTSLLVSWVGTPSRTKRKIAFTTFVTTSRIPKLTVWVVLVSAKLHMFSPFSSRNVLVLFSVI